MFDFLAWLARIVRADLAFYWDCPVWDMVVEDRAECIAAGITGDGSTVEFADYYGGIEGVVPYRAA